MRPALAVAYGGGGPFGIAYDLGVAHGLREGGVELRDAPALGTSAGSWVASFMVLDIGPDQLGEIGGGRLSRERGVLEATARALVGDGHHPNVSAVAVPVGAARRVVLRGDEHRLADIIAASSAVPGVFAPHRVGGRLYVDGGIRSAASIDLAAPADHLIAVVPLAGAMLRGPVRGLDALLSLETATWRRKHRGGRVTVIRPNQAIAACVGSRPTNAFDWSRAAAVYPLAFEQGRRWADRIRHPAAPGRAA